MHRCENMFQNNERLSINNFDGIIKKKIEKLQKGRAGTINEILGLIYLNAEN